MGIVTETAKSKEKGVTLFPATVSYMPEGSATDDNINTAEADIRNFKLGNMTETDYGQLLHTKKLTCDSV